MPDAAVDLAWRDGQRGEADVDLVCEGCKKEFRARMTVAVDVAGHPAVRDELHGQSFNAADCPHCGRKQVVAARPLVWHDRDRGLSLVYWPFGPEQAVRQGLVAPSGLVNPERLCGESVSGFAKTILVFTPHEFYHQFMFFERLAARRADKGTTPPRTVEPLSEDAARLLLEKQFGTPG